MVVPPCIDCGELRPLLAHGLCNRCLQKSPDTTRTYADGLASRLGAARPRWYYAFVAHVVGRYSPSEARLRLRELGRLLRTHDRPCGTGDGSVPTLTVASRHWAAPLTSSSTCSVRVPPRATPRHALAGCRTRVIDTIPQPLRPMVAAFSATELANRERARRTGARVLTDRTLLIHLQVIADFARSTPIITDWSTVAQGDIEAFLVRRSPTASTILPSLRVFFAWARQQRLILVDPTQKLHNRLRRRFSGPVVDLPTQRRLFRRWTTELEVTPNEALVGLLTLLHAASVNDLRHLSVDDVNHAARTIALSARPQPVPLDPPTWVALQAALGTAKASTPPTLTYW